MKSITAQKSERASTGIEGLDYLLDGGIPRASLVLLAGAPGSGKTSLAAHFLYHGAAQGDPGIYVSFAEDRASFMKNMKQLGLDFEPFEQKGLFKMLDFVTVKEGGTSTVVGKVLLEIASMQAKRLILDSFSAMAFADQSEARTVIHTVFSRVIRAHGCTTLMIAEGQDIERQMPGYVSDGIIKLVTEKVEERIIRELEIDKMRGVKLNQRNAIFTIDKGLRVIPTFTMRKYPQKLTPKVFPDAEEKISTGIKDLDALLGDGINKGTVAFFELAGKLLANETMLLIMPTMINAAKQDKGIVEIPAAGAWDAESTRTVCMNYGLTDAEVDRLLRYFDYSAAETKPYTVSMDRSDIFLAYSKRRKVEADLVTVTGKKPFGLVGLDTLETVYGTEQVKSYMDLDARTNRSERGIVYWTGKPGMDSVTQRAANIADVHLKIFKKDGAMLLWAVKPDKGLFAIEVETEEGSPVVKLIPII
jgi:KaiC/GvpD/RAD55 family RecA-like ATPase